VKKISGRSIMGTVAIMSVAAVGFALFTQHVLDMQPCPWCILQRMIYLLIVLAAGIGALLKQRLARLISAFLVIVLVFAGIAAAAWQHFEAASRSNCSFTLADKIISATHLDLEFPAIFAVYSSCADAAVTLLGIPYEFWSSFLYLALGVLAVLALTRRT
jgi:protein dithiol:quinone oxidoreductase